MIKDIGWISWPKAVRIAYSPTRMMGGAMEYVD